jgi:hypothetical protein
LSSIFVMLNWHFNDVGQSTVTRTTDTSRVWLSDVSTRISAAMAKRIAPMDPTRMTASLLNF